MFFPFISVLLLTFPSYAWIGIFSSKCLISIFHRNVYMDLYLFDCSLDDNFSIFINDQNVSRFEMFKSVILSEAHRLCSSFSWLSKRMSLHFYMDRKERIKYQQTRTCACGSACMCIITLRERGKKRMANLTRLWKGINMDTN